MSKEQLTAAEAQNLSNYLASVAQSIQDIANEPADAPILDEYCWMHDSPNGGWSCAVCIAEQKEAQA